MNIPTYIDALTQAVGYYQRGALEGQRFCVGKADVCLDMVAKLRRYGTFASDRQRAYAGKLILWACPNPVINLDAVGTLASCVDLNTSETDNAAVRTTRQHFARAGWRHASPSERLQYYAEQVPGYSEYIASRNERSLGLDPNGGQQPTIAPSAVADGASAQPEALPHPLAHLRGSAAPAIDMSAMQRVQRLFQAARDHGLRRPRIVINIEGMRLRLYPGTRNPAATNVRLLRGGLSTYVGFISPEGIFVERDAGVGSGAEYAQRIAAFGRAPEEVARAHGLATGNCCFCQRELTDQRSVAMGYGPICAEHYGLDWGNRRARLVEVREVAPSVVQRVPPLLPQLSAQRAASNFNRAEAEGMRRMHEDLAEGIAFQRAENEQERAAYEAEMERDASHASRRGLSLLDDEDRVFMRRLP